MLNIGNLLWRIGALLDFNRKRAIWSAGAFCSTSGLSFDGIAFIVALEASLSYRRYKNSNIQHARQTSTLTVLGRCLSNACWNHLKMRIQITIAAVCALLCVSCNNPLDILGPRDKPDFRNKNWTAITITYWVSTKTTNQLERVFTVTDTSIIEGLKTNMNIKEISGLSIGTRNQLRFQERNGDSWHGSVVFENRINLSSTADKWRSYTIDLSDYSLFDAMLELCVQNERTFHPKAKPENIILRHNIIRVYPVVEE